MFYYTQLSPSSLPSEKNWLLTVLAYSYSAAAAVWKRKRKKRDSSSVSGTSFSLPFFFFLEIKSASLRGNSGGGSEKEEEDSRPKVFSCCPFRVEIDQQFQPKATGHLNQWVPKKCSIPEFFFSSLWCEPRCRRVPLFT